MPPHLLERGHAKRGVGIAVDPRRLAAARAFIRLLSDHLADLGELQEIKATVRISWDNALSLLFLADLLAVNTAGLVTSKNREMFMV